MKLNLELDRDRAAVQDAFLTAELDLEWTGAIVYERDHFRRAGQANDPVPVPPDALRGVAEAVWSLGWPNPGHKPSRSIHECFLALNGRYRHCDVYWAMHKYLKGNRLRVVRRNWMLLKNVEAVLADPTLSIEERAELERELEHDLVNDYVAWLGRRDVRKHLFKNGREADLYDPERQVIIEAKANHRDDVMVAHGMGQAMYYRSLDQLGPDDRIAVLLPGRPCDEVVRLLWVYDVGLIYRDDEAFKEEWP
ncbi:hypothetical protein QOZ88_05050 [Blastococcus sp. BMG 814]|uniref:Uncharacterized protein n=1 Tax=Blastococcus carthaginiensis TaxID=3050034 RepID=A0ABT9I8U8_9ACTN|nr:hypothetical protein [Blastococcus carthaginiensis]MDP5181997.1 hypothetical protein [Blastococcus carthaginiensis]